MKKMFYQYIRYSASIAFCVCFACLLGTGCASTKTTTQTAAIEPTAHKSTINSNLNFNVSEKRLINAERKERQLMYQLDHAKSTDEIIRCKDELNKIHAEIAELKKHKDTLVAPDSEGFKSVKERNYTYGPLGVVFKLTQWILEKLYLIRRS